MLCVLTAVLLASPDNAEGSHLSRKSGGNSLGFGRVGGSLEHPALLEQCLSDAYSPELNIAYMFL